MTQDKYLKISGIFADDVTRLILIIDCTVTFESLWNTVLLKKFNFVVFV